MLVRHLHGNILSRFTDFLDSDGEKSWRERENEFARVAIDEPEARRLWAEAWDLLDETLAGLKDEDLDREAAIRGQTGSFGTGGTSSQSRAYQLPRWADGCNGACGNGRFLVVHEYPSRGYGRLQPEPVQRAGMISAP